MIDAQRQGISMILQEANTIPMSTVAQNLFAGREEEFSRFGIISMGKMFHAADDLLKKFGIDHIRGADPLLITLTPLQRFVNGIDTLDARISKRPLH